MKPKLVPPWNIYILKEIPYLINLDTVYRISVEGGENRRDTETLDKNCHFQFHSPQPIIRFYFIFLLTSGWNHPEQLLKNKFWHLQHFIFFNFPPCTIALVQIASKLHVLSDSIKLLSYKYLYLKNIYT